MPSLTEIVAHLGGRIVGDAETEIRQVASLDGAGDGEIAFLSGSKHRAALSSTRATAVILASSFESSTTLPRIVADNPYLYFARLAQWLNPLPAPYPGVHPSAIVESVVDASVSVGANAYIGPGCEIGSDVVVGPGCIVEAGVSLGCATRLYGGVTIYSGCKLGERCIVHSGTVIGSDGFGFARNRDGSWDKIPQIGCVRIGNDVEFGANCAIDRGTLDDTVIADGVKLDNLVHIAHNVSIGEHSALAGCVGVAGSAHIGARVMVGGQAGIVGHIEVVDDTVISGRTLISKSIRKSGVYTSAIPAMPHDSWMKSAAHFRHLDSMVSRLRELEKRIAELEKEA